MPPTEPDARYPVPARTTRVEDEVKRSRFITTAAHAPTAEAARAFIQSVRDEFPDATHHCWAYVIGAPGSTRATGASDAGEPPGTAGRPMLAALLGAGVGEVAAVVTRYFGGVKLGRGGLVRAYSGGVQHVLREMPVTPRVVRVAGTVEVPYGDLDAVRRVLENRGGSIEAEAFGAEGVRWTVRVPAHERAAIERDAADASRGRARVAFGESDAGDA